jgi:hypothetical protein
LVFISQALTIFPILVSKLHFSKEIRKYAVKDNMNTMEIRLNQDSYTWITIKWISLFIFLTLCFSGLYKLHQQQLVKLSANSDALNQKSFLVSKMHDEMLSISRMQLQILHASNEQQVKKDLLLLSELVTDHLIHYYQLKNIADESDAELLMRFRLGFDKWQNFNEDLLGYANVIADSGFINTLNMVDLTISQLDQDADKALLLISQLK